MGKAIPGTEGNRDQSAVKLDGEAGSKAGGKAAGKQKGGGSSAAQSGSESAGAADTGTEKGRAAASETKGPSVESSVRVEQPQTIQYPDPVPEPISLDQLKGRKQEEKQQRQQQAAAMPKQPPPVRVPSLRTGIELLAKAVYSVPALAQQGDWWYLSNEEAKTIGEQGEAAISTLESKRIMAAHKFFNSVAPWVALVVTVVSVTYIRVSMTSAAYAKARSLGPQDGSANNSGAAGNGGVSGNGAAAGSGPTKDRVARSLESLD